MVISDAIRILRDSVVKQIFIGEDDAALIGFINLGILEIHKRFRLSFGEAVITPVTGRREYYLDSLDNAVSIDLSRNDLLVIECIEDAEGEPVGLNKHVDSSSAKATAYNAIKLGAGDTSSSYTVTYRASPAFVYSDSDIIRLSPVFIEALFHYVGYQAYLSVNGDEQTQHNLHKKRFEGSLKMIVDNGLYVQNDISTDKLYDRGYV